MRKEQEVLLSFKLKGLEDSSVLARMRNLRCLTVPTPTPMIFVETLEKPVSFP